MSMGVRECSISSMTFSSCFILNLNPWLYIGKGAAQGDAGALWQMGLIESIQRKRESYNL